MYAAQYTQPGVYGQQPMYQQQTQTGYGAPAGMGMQGGMSDTYPSCRQLAYQPPQFSPQLMPLVPQMQDAHPTIQQHMPQIAMTVAQEVVRHATLPNTNAAFIYLFNTVASQGFSGGDWVRIVEFCAMLTWTFMMERQGASAQNLIQEAAASTVMYKASVMAVGNQLVMNSLDAGTRNDVVNLANEHEVRRQAFAQLLVKYQQQMQMQANPTAAYGGVVGGAMLARQVPQQAPAAVGQAVFAQAPAATLPMQGYGAPAGAPVVQAPAAPAPRKKGPLFDFDSPDLVTDVTEVVPAPAVQQQAPVAVPAATVTQLWDGGVTAAPVQQAPIVTEAEWRPSRVQRYMPLVYKHNSKLFFEAHVLHGAEVTVLALEQSLSEEEMNRSEYAIPGFNKAVHLALEAKHGEKADHKFMNDVDLIAKGIKQSSVREKPEVTTMFAQVGLDIITSTSRTELEDVTSIKNGFAKAEVDRLINGSDKQSLYHVSGSLIEAEIIGPKPMSDMMQAFEKALNYEHLGSLLNTSIDAAVDDIQELVAVRQINDFLTKTFNALMGIGMGLDIRIDSYREDISQVMGTILEFYGEAYEKELRDHWKQFLKTTIGAAELDEVIEVEIKSKEEKQVCGYTTFLQQPSTFTLIDIDSEDLGFGMQTNRLVYEIFPANFPALHRFFEAVADTNPDAINYFMTTDRVVYGMRRSIMADKVIVVWQER